MSSARPVLVLLHGVGLDHTVWDQVAPSLETTYDVRRPDLPGHGAGVRVPGDVGLAGLAELTARDIPIGAHLVGFSLGALVAQHLAVHRPDLVASLLSVSSVCRRTDAERDAVLARLATAETDHAASVEASLTRWFEGTAVAAEVVAHTRRVLMANDHAQYLACYRVFATGDSDVSPVLDRIAVPSIAVTGSEDPGSTPAMTRRLTEAVPGCRAVVAPGVRHMLPVQAPDVLITLIHELIGGRIHA